METAELESFFSGSWTGTTERCKASLDSDDLDTIGNFTSWFDVKEQLLSSLPASIDLIQPALCHINVFASFFETRLGPRLDVSLFWGAIACLLQLSAEDSALLEKVPRMIKSLAHKAEAFNRYCDEAKVIGNLIKEACFDMQVQILEFFINSIRYIHGVDDESPLRRSETPLRLIERCFSEVNQELGEAVSRVEKLTIINPSFQPQAPRSWSSQRCLMIPPTRTIRFFNRTDIHEDLDRILGLGKGRTSFRSVALHGLGGVGKTSIASTYMERRYKENIYDVCLWVQGEKGASLRQSFTDIALRLKLPGAQPQTHDDNLILVQDWLQYTESTWLLVYDNVESAEILMPYWPASSKGRAIITTRNHSLAFEPASEGLEVVSWDAMTGSEFLLWLLKRRIGRDLEAESRSALTLSQRLGGHALIITQMAGLIHKLNFSIQDFMAMYLKNPQNAHAKDEIKAIWEISFKSLSDDSQSLLAVISFLMPDSIPQEVFASNAEYELPETLAFCVDDFRFSEALGTLAILGLIKRDIDTRTLSTHRMVQTQFKYFLTTEQRQQSFSNAVSLLRGVFPAEDTKAGQLYDRWEACNRYLQHVVSLRDTFVEEQKSSKDFKAPWQFSDLLNRSQRFLFETCASDECERTCVVNRAAVEQLEPGPRKEDFKATILSHQAQMAEGLGNAELAIRLNQEGYQIRLAEQPLNRVVLCYTAANLGYSYGAANNHTAALQWTRKAREWWGDLPNYPPNIVANEARCLVYLDDLQGARALLDVFINEVKRATSTNWAVLAYGYFLIGVFYKRQHDFETAEQYFLEAQNAWLKGDQTRLHPFNGGCMYSIGASCLYQGKVESAIKNIRDSIVVTKFHQKTRPADHARNLFKLSEALLQDGQDSSNEEARVLRDEAEIYLRKRDPDAVNCNTDEAYDKWVPIFWR